MDLTSETVRAWLADRALPSEGEVEELSGGVSSTVVAVGDVVVKQALPRFKVADEWLVDPNRIVTEARALRLVQGLTPHAVPQVLYLDEDEHVVVMQRAPRRANTWKSALLAGEAEPAVGRRLGELLSAWHTATAGDELVARRFAAEQSFREQRVDPYFGTLMARRPEIAALVGAVIDDMLATRACLTHGDFSPKNVLVWDDGLWVVDWEVVHHGDPAFDGAFLLCHLTLKAVHGRAPAAAYERCARPFLDTWLARLPAALPVSTDHLVALTACLVLARVDGKSPAEYLTEGERAAARALGDSLLRDPPSSVSAIWRRLTGL